MTEWVTALELAKAMQQSNLGQTKVQALARRAAAGLLRAQADCIIRNGERQASNEMLPADWNGQVKTADLRLGDFEILTQPSQYRWVTIKALGVRFARADAEKMGAIFGADTPAPEAGPEPEPTVDTVEVWAQRMVSFGIKQRQCDGALLKATWRGPESSLPLVKEADGALREALRKAGKGGLGRPPGS